MCRSLSGRFIGDPTYEYEYIDVKVVGEGEEAEEETNTVNLMLNTDLVFIIRTCYVTPLTGYTDRLSGPSRILCLRSALKLNNVESFCVHHLR